MNRFTDDWMLFGPRNGVMDALLGRQLKSFSKNQLIALRSERNGEMWFPIPDLYNPKVIWMASFYGLYVSRDGGWNYTREFIGVGPRGHDAYEVGIDRFDHRYMLLGTGEGSYYSTDRGQNWIKHPGKFIGEWLVFSFTYYPFDPHYIFACTDHGLLRSRDRGASWELAFWSARRRQRMTRNLEFDPWHPGRLYVTTFDGLFVTDDALNATPDSWRRVAPTTFTNMYMRSIYICTKHKGHIWALAAVNTSVVASPGLRGGAPQFISGHLYESIDDGKTWKVMYQGSNFNNIVWALPGPAHDPDMLLIFSARSLIRMRRAKPGAPPPNKSWSPPDLPPAADVIRAALRYTGSDPEIRLKYRELARYKALVPRVDVSFRQQVTNSFSASDDGLYPILPFRRRSELPYNQSNFQAMLMWDLSDLVFPIDSIFAGREYRINDQLRRLVTQHVHMAYGKMRQLTAILANAPPDDLRTRLHYRTRIAEAYATLNFITGGYLEHWRASGRPAGATTKWWKRWKPLQVSGNIPTLD